MKGDVGVQCLEAYPRSSPIRGKRIKWVVSCLDKHCMVVALHSRPRTSYFPKNLSAPTLSGALSCN
eukprot:4589904-Amphidinium_carterae.2